MADRELMLLRPSLVRTLFFVAIAGVSLVLIDSVLANTERRETALEAARFSREGQRLMREGKYADAAESFRSAIANARVNTEYPLALGQALLGAGDFDDAEATLTELLKSDSMAGAPNLAMARVFVKEGEPDEAAFYFHRAIYGQWKDDPQGNRLKARFELADFLANRNSKADLLAELIPLQGDAPSDASTQMKLARLFMTAGSPARAATIFHGLARAHPGNPDAHEGEGEAELALGNCSTAQSAYAAALRQRAGDPQAWKGLDLCDQVLNLDPMRRGLGGPERYQRSVRVLQLVADRVTQCRTPAQSTAATDLVNAAQAALKGHVSAAAQSDAVEANLDLAARLWAAEKAGCWSTTPVADDPLQLLLTKSAQ